MSSALRTHSTEYCRASGFIGRCSAINVVRSPHAQHWVLQSKLLYRLLCIIATTSGVRFEFGIIYAVEEKITKTLTA
jgi:hypothetical protein